MQLNDKTKKLSPQGDINFDMKAADGQFKKTASNKKLRSRLSGFQFTPMSEGIKETVEWLKANYDFVRK